MQAIILARVSSKEQEEGHSIAAQIQRLNEYCSRRGFTVLETFQIIESSTRGERKEFHRMIDFAQRHPQTVAVVAEAVDRVQRSFKESVFLDDLIKRDKIELHFYREGMVIGKNASASDIMRWDFSVIGAKSYVHQLSENVKRSLDWKVKNGEITGPAPLGYINAKDCITGRNSVMVNPATSPLVERLFAEYATGAFSMGDMIRKAAEWGLTTKNGKKIAKSQIHFILTNPFYYGEMMVKGQRVPHRYEPIITKEIYNLCQEVRLGYGRKPFRYTEKPYIFRGLLTCFITGHMVTNDQKTKNYAGGGQGTWTYLVAGDPDRPGKKIFVREETVVEQLQNVLRQFSIPDEILSEIRLDLKNSHAAERRFHEESIMSLNRQATKISDRMHRLTDIMLDGLLSPEEAQAKRHELISVRDEIQAQLLQHQKGDDGFMSTLETVLSLTNRAYSLFTGSNFDEKRKLIALLFSNLQLEGKKLRYSLRYPFNEFAKLRTRSEWLRG